MVTEHSVGVLTIFLAVVSGFYGVYATVTDFKKKVGNRQTLSLAGRWGLVFLTLTTGTSIGLETLKNRVAAAKEETAKRENALQQTKLNAMSDTLGAALRQTKDITGSLQAATRVLNLQSASLERVASEGSATLSATDRLLDPLDDKALVSVYEEITPGQPSVESWVARLAGKHVARSPGSPTFPSETDPNERDLSYFAQNQSFRISFHKTQDLNPCIARHDCSMYQLRSTRTAGSSDLLLIVDSCDQAEEHHTQVRLSSDDDGQSFNCEYREQDLQPLGSTRSYKDLRGTYAFVEVSLFSSLSADAQTRPINFTLSKINIRGKSSRISLQSFKKIPCYKASEVCFVGLSQ